MLNVSKKMFQIYRTTLRIVAVLAASACVPMAHAADLNLPIPRSVAGDKGKYILIEAKRTGNVVASLHKRVGVNETGYSRVEANCSTKQYRDMGYSEDDPGTIKANPGKWTDLVEGSSKSDLVKFVCQRF